MPATTMRQSASSRTSRDADVDELQDPEAEGLGGASGLLGHGEIGGPRGDDADAGAVILRSGRRVLGGPDNDEAGALMKHRARVPVENGLRLSPGGPGDQHRSS
jgi:hypothetical protein